MREIKFRAWDDKNKKMWHFNFPFTVQASPSFMKTFCFMQWTGLTDKNGKEIYEGDLFMDEEDGTYDHIVWNEWFGGWGTNRWFTPEGLVKECDTLEVIGNIYENSELLK